MHSASDLFPQPSNKPPHKAEAHYLLGVNSIFVAGALFPSQLGCPWGEDCKINLNINTKKKSLCWSLVRWS